MKSTIYASAPQPVKDMYQRLKKASGHDVHVHISRVAVMHLVRYQKADELVDGLDVLDVACGAGYGSIVLGHARSYEGLDLDETALKEARREFPEFSFRQGSIFEMPYADESFGAVVCFETLEHVPEPEHAIDEIARVLNPGGLLIASVPIDHPDRIHHVRPYSAAEGVGILTSNSGLRPVQLLLQTGTHFAPLDLNREIPHESTVYGILAKASG